MQNKWLEYWNTDAKNHHEVFASTQGVKPENISAFWQAQFVNINANTKCLDIASGAGSVYADLTQLQQDSLELHACDISQAALEKLQQRFDNVQITQADATKLPFDDNQFDMVASQFGVEYAGKKGFQEAFRVLKDNGLFCALCHAKDSVIDQKNQRLLAAADLVQESGFIDVAIRLVNAQCAKSTKRLAQAKQDFITPEKMLSDSFKAGSTEGIHAHVYFGFKKMYTNLSKYAKDDVIAWLKHTIKEVRHNQMRLKTMCDAALDETALIALQKALNDRTKLKLQWQLMQVNDDANVFQPLAWQLCTQAIKKS